MYRSEINYLIDYIDKSRDFFNFDKEAAFVGGVSILGGKGGVIGAAVGSLTVNFLNTGLVFYAMQVHFVQFFTSVLLVVVIVFQTMSRIFDSYQTRKSYLTAIDARSKILLEKKKNLNIS